MPLLRLEKSNTLFNLHDNTYWSSPITSATIQGVFPGVNPARIFEYKAGDPNPVYAGVPGYENYIYWWNKPSGSMDVGYGYAVEGPDAPVDANDDYITPFQHRNIVYWYTQIMVLKSLMFFIKGRKMLI